MSMSATVSALWSRIHRIPLVAQIAVGMLAGILLALASPASIAPLLSRSGSESVCRAKPSPSANR